MGRASVASARGARIIANPHPVFLICRVCEFLACAPAIPRGIDAPPTIVLGVAHLFRCYCPSRILLSTQSLPPIVSSQFHVRAHPMRLPTRSRRFALIFALRPFRISKMLPRPSQHHIPSSGVALAFWDSVDVSPRPSPVCVPATFPSFSDFPLLTTFPNLRPSRNRFRSTPMSLLL